MNLTIDPRTGLPIIPKDWLTITRDAPSWNEAMNADVPGHQRVSFTPEAQALLQNTPEGFGNWSNYGWGFGANDGGPGNYMWQQWTDPTLMSVLKKTGEREGTRYGYSLDESGNYVPGEVLGTEEFYTNNGDMNKKALLAAAALVGGGLGANALMTGNMFTAAAPGAMNFGGAAGAAASGAPSVGGGAAGGTTAATTSPMSGLLSSEALFLGADPRVLAAAGLDPALTSAAMGGASGLGAGGPTMGAALTAGLGAEGAALTDTMLGLGGLGGVEAGAGSLKNMPWDKLAKAGATLAGGLLGGAAKDQGGGGQSARAPFSPSGMTVGQRTYQPNANNVSEMQRLLDYLAARGNPKRDALGLLGGGSKYYGLIGGGNG